MSMVDRLGTSAPAGLRADISGIAPARAPEQPAERPAETIDELDAEAVALRASAERMTAWIARTAQAFVSRAVWKPAGYANLDGHARERLDRSGRWVRDLANLADAMDRFPALERALGSLGRSRATVIAPVLDEENANAWIERAHFLSVRELKRRVRASRFDARIDRDALEETVRVRLVAWPQVKTAFDEMVDVGRAALGNDATVARVVDAMLGETGLIDAGLAETVDAALGSGMDGEGVADRAFDHVIDRWSVPARFGSGASEMTASSALDISTLDDFGLEQHMRTLIALEDAIERRIGALLVEMADRGAWPRLLYKGLGHYAQERLGMARTTAEDRALAARGLRRLPALGSAYASGRLPFEKALIVLRILGRAPVTADLERAWLEHAVECTVKRLRDEARELRRSGRTAPPTDAEWYASIGRVPGQTRTRVMAAGVEVLRSIEHGVRPDVFLRLRLPASTAMRLMAAIERRRREIETEVGAIPWDRPWPADDARPAVRAARELPVRARRVPACLGLLSLIEEAVATWDLLRGPLRPHGARIHERAGYRCEAPGCPNRDGNEWHHLKRVSLGGSDDDTNGIDLCWRHHHEGEHGGLTRAEGVAPLGITWRLGTGPFATSYRNERRI